MEITEWNERVEKLLEHLDFVTLVQDSNDRVD